jgi:preprotein translocase subunit SecG
MSLLIGIFTFALVLVSLFLIMVVLMQKAKSDGGVAAMGGGVAESTFGAETGNVLSKATIRAAIAFFLISLGLYLAHIYRFKHQAAVDAKLPTITAPGTVLPAAPTAKPAAQPITPPPSVPAKP